MNLSDKFNKFVIINLKYVARIVQPKWCSIGLRLDGFEEWVEKSILNTFL